MQSILFLFNKNKSKKRKLFHFFRLLLRNYREKFESIFNIMYYYLYLLYFCISFPWQKKIKKLRSLIKFGIIRTNKKLIRLYGWSVCFMLRELGSRLTIEVYLIFFFEEKQGIWQTN